MEENVNRKIVLEELRRAFDKTYASSDMLDAKLQNLFNFASIILPVISSVELLIFHGRVAIIYWVLLIIALIAYIIAYLEVKIGLNPVTYQFPISNNWEELNIKYFNSTEEKLLDQLIDSHIRVMEKVEMQNAIKVKAVKIVSFLIMAIVILLVIIAPIGLLTQP